MNRLKFVNAAEFFLLSCCCLITLSNALTHRQDQARILETDVGPAWGTWRNWDYCPEGQFVYGMRLKVERYKYNTRASDDTALNSIRLFCAPLGANEIYEEIVSYESPWGLYDRNPKYCTDSVANGFQIKFEGGHGGDNLATTNVKLFCADGKTLEGEGLDDGNWRNQWRCNRQEALCGIQVQFMDYAGEGLHYTSDDTGLNGVKMACCKVVHNTTLPCQPRPDSWRVVAAIDNRHNVTDWKYTFIEVTGASTQITETNSQKVEQQLGVSISSNTELGGGDLGWKQSILIGFEAKTTTGTEWSKSSTEILNSEIRHEQSFTVPPGKIYKLEQAVAFCSGISVKSKNYRIVDFNEHTEKKITFR